MRILDDDELRALVPPDMAAWLESVNGPTWAPPVAIAETMGYRRAWVPIDAKDEAALTMGELITYVEGFKMVGAVPIGPLYGAGWNGAVGAIVKALKAKEAGGGK